MKYLESLPDTADLVIIGGGVVGAATAFYAARAGLNPLLLEAQPRLCTATTAASAGAFRLQFDNREELDLVRRSVDLFLNFAEQTGQTQYDLNVRQQGYLWLTKTEEGAERQRQLVDKQHNWGLTDVELLEADALKRRFPFVAPDVLQGRFRQADGFLYPKQLTLGLAAGSEAGVLAGCRVLGFEIAGNRLRGVRTQLGTVESERAVIAAGPFSAELASTAGMELPLSTVLRHKLVFPDLPEVPREAPMVIDDDTGVHWRPSLAGAFALYPDPATPATPPVEDIPLDHNFPFLLLDPSSSSSLARTAPFWRSVWRASAANWLLQAGYYTITPDQRPVIGETEIEGLFVNTGYAGHGVMAGPAGSQLLAKLLSGKLANQDNPFRLDRGFGQQRRMDKL